MTWDKLIEGLKTLIDAIPLIRPMWESAINLVINLPDLTLILILILVGLLAAALFAYFRANRPQQGDIKAFAYVRAVSMIADSDRNEISVDCNVNFLGIADGAETSPSELVLKIPGEEPPAGIICELKAPLGSKRIERYGWEWMPYRGSITRNGAARLRRAIEKAMTPKPEGGQVFAAVEIDLPLGQALQAHQQSGVQFYPPTAIAARPSFLVTIANWTQGIPPDWR